MKKAVGIAVLAIVAGTGIIYIVRTAIVQSVAAQVEVSQNASKTVQAKIDAIKKARDNPNRNVAEKVEVTDSDLESYVLFELKDDIPAKIESLDVQLTEGAVAADAKMTFGQNPTNNQLIDVLISGTHRLFVKGKLSATGGTGMFNLQEARVDGIPVPTILIETLVDKYVKPKHPDVKLDEPFMMPWGIEDLTVTNGKATIVY
jgi:hypothetical protein